ncbi:MAG TPA: acyl--CoA ligase [Acidimicrobiia bacterium]|nr:acyl--CoA ligase [Acidimicrobiia bacterium]
MSTINELLRAADADSVALFDVDGVFLTYEALRQTVDSLAESLRSRGVGPGDRVAIVLPNGPEMAIMFLAVVSVGCAAPLNPKYREAEFRFYLEDLGAKALVVPPGGHPDAERAAGSEILRLTAEGTMGGLRIDAGGTAGRLPNAAPEEGSVALVLHTSGTTSRPKVVPLRQRNLAASARNVAASLELGPADRSLNVMPLFHIHGLVAGLLAPLSAGGSVVCTPGFDPFRFHGWLESLAPTFYTSVPAIHQLVLQRAPQPRPLALRFVRSSSSALPTRVHDDLRALFEVPVIEAYGMTEASHQMTSNPLPPLPAKPGSVGKATGIDVAVLDAVAGARLLPGDTGEVCVRGTTIVDGYENNEEANRASFTDAGWFRTGDEGFLDQDGYLFLTGRIKEQINRGGEKVSPLEVDEVLMSHPDVAQAVAFALSDPVLGEEVGAAVVLREGRALTEAEVRRHASTRLAAFKVPRRVFFVDEIPKGPTGKVQRIGLAKTLGVE